MDKLLARSLSKLNFIPNRLPLKKLLQSKITNTSKSLAMEALGRFNSNQVWKAVHKKTKKSVAVKEMDKLRVIDTRSTRAILKEKKVLEAVSSKFIANLKAAFQDKEKLFLVLDYFPMGDLRFQLSKQSHLSEEQVKSIIACVICALEDVHSSGFVHRDIKPENLVFDCHGYVFLTDFGISKSEREDLAGSTSGTPGYMSPEVMCGLDHGFTADFFSVGVLCFELLLGKRPYCGKTRNEIKNKIMSKQAVVRGIHLETVSLEAADFTNKLLQRKPFLRLGRKGIKQLKEHSWFRGFDWESLRNKTAFMPFKPVPVDKVESYRPFNRPGTETLERFNRYKREKMLEKEFKDFSAVPLKLNKKSKRQIPLLIFKHRKSRSAGQNLGLSGLSTKVLSSKRKSLSRSKRLSVSSVQV